MRTLAVGSMVQVPFSVTEANDARDALAKTLYDRVFAWIVAKINVNFKERNAKNASAAGGSGEVLKIGILDIFGFEKFRKNGFEQLCINYCNEKLHNFFNEKVFQAELQMYEKESIVIAAGDLVYSDNSGILKMIEGKKSGLISLLDNELKVGLGMLFSIYQLCAMFMLLLLHSIMLFYSPFYGPAVFKCSHARASCTNSTMYIYTQFI